MDGVVGTGSHNHGFAVALRRHPAQRTREIFGRKFEKLVQTQRAALEDMTPAMINKLLHTPISQLKRNSGDEDEDAALYVAGLKKLLIWRKSEAYSPRHAG